MVVLGHKIFAIGGRDGDVKLTSVECLDLNEADPAWTLTSSSLNTGRSEFGACVVDNVND